jgi:hypothetical protein
MPDVGDLDDDLWHAFLARHRLGMGEQEAFLDYLTEQPDLSIDSMTALEQVYQAFLRRDLPPTAS